MLRLVGFQRFPDSISLRGKCKLLAIFVASQKVGEPKPCGTCRLRFRSLHYSVAEFSSAYLLTWSRILSDGWKVTTLLAEISIFSPVWGFRPGLDLFSFTVHFPNPEILTSFPASSLSLISSKTISRMSLLL